MPNATYHVIYRGKILPGFEPETAKQNLMKLFAIDELKAGKIIGSQRIALKKNVDEARAKKFGIALKKAGLDIALTRSDPGAPQAAKAPAAAGKKQPSGQPVAEAPAAPVAAAGGKIARLSMEFTGKGSEYFKIWLVNIILTILTIGIYSPWAKVRRKQYFYGNTRLQGNSFEYLASPTKILKGRLILVGFIAISSLADKFVPIVGKLLGLVFLIVFPWLVVRSLAFNARNSATRNIRFGFSGSVKEAGKVYILWPFVTTLTLGILFPYVYFRQKKFIVENSSYGTTPFKFGATAKDYYRIFFSAVIPILIGLAAMAAAWIMLPPGFSFVGALIALGLYLYLFAFYSVKTTNLLYNSSRLGPHRLESTMQVRPYLSLIITNSLATALTLGLFHPWAKIRTMRYKLDHLVLKARRDLDGFVAHEQKQVSALGEEAADFFDIDFGL